MLVFVAAASNPTHVKATWPCHTGIARKTGDVPGLSVHGQICGQDGIAVVREVFDDYLGAGGKDVQGRRARGRSPAPLRGARQVKNFPIFAWGFTIGPAIAKLYAEWEEVGHRVIGGSGDPVIGEKTYRGPTASRDRFTRMNAHQKRGQAESGDREIHGRPGQVG